MKTLILETAAGSGSSYQLWAELLPSADTSGGKMLVFSSIWEGAKHPHEHQKKCEFFLSPDAIAKLKTVLDEQ
jgi:hypothetical protein